ncbi:MAG: hypothetical protein ACFFBD_07785 [Candidatus Hodarchaeota archaeon]
MNGVLQEIFACIFLSTLNSLLSKEAEVRLQQDHQMNPKPRKHHYQLNRVVRYTTVMDFLVNLLLQEQSTLEDTLSGLIHQIRQTPVVIRLGRSFKRKNDILGAVMLLSV